MSNPFLKNHTKEHLREWGRRGGSAKSPAKSAQLARLAQTNVGKKKPPGKSEAGTGHWKSKFWVLISPEKKLVYGVNLNEIVRRNAHLFPAKYLRLDGPSRPKAAHRLRMLFYVHRGRHGRSQYVLSNWNGWMAADSAEMVKCVIPRCYEVKLRPRLGAENDPR